VRRAYNKDLLTHRITWLIKLKERTENVYFTIRMVATYNKQVQNKHN